MTTARHKLADLADAFLMHDRDIQVPCDDSVVRPVAPAGRDPRAPGPGFRAQSHLPAPGIRAHPGGRRRAEEHLLPGLPHVAILSQHIGDLDTVETFDYYSQAIAHFKALCRKDPAIVAHDLHPLYLSTRYASGLAGVRLMGVQHHHAHIAACLAENRRTGPNASASPWTAPATAPTAPFGAGKSWWPTWRALPGPGHLAPVRLPGGEAAVRDPQRMAVAYLYGLYGGGFRRPGPGVGPGLSAPGMAHPLPAIDPGINSPLTTSAGRLFDAVAAALNVCRDRTYEGQPAIELEMVADDDEDGFYPAPVRWAGHPDPGHPDHLPGRGGEPPGRRGRRPHRRPLPQLPGPAAHRGLRIGPGSNRPGPGGPVRRGLPERPAFDRLQQLPGETRFRGADPHPDSAQRRLHLPGPGGRGRGAVGNETQEVGETRGEDRTSTNLLFDV